MRPKSQKNKRRDSKKRYKNYPYTNKKEIRTDANRAVRRYKDTFPPGKLYEKLYDIWWTIW